MANPPSPLEKEVMAAMRQASKDRILDEEQFHLLAQDLITEFNTNPLSAQEIYQATYLRNRILYEQDPTAAPKFKEAYNTFMKGIAKRLRDHDQPENQTGIIKVGMYNRAKARIGLTKPVWDSREDAARESTALFEALYAGMDVLYRKVQGKLTRSVNLFGSPFARVDVAAFEKAQLGPDFTALMGKLAPQVKLLTPGLHRQNHLLFEILRRQMGQLPVPREYMAWAFIGRDEFFTGLHALATQAMMKTGRAEEFPPEEQKRRAEALVQALDFIPVAGDAAEAYVRDLSRILGRNLAPRPPEELDSVTIQTGEDRLEDLVVEFTPVKDPADGPAPGAGPARPRSAAAGKDDDLVRTRGFVCNSRAFFAMDQARVESFLRLETLRKMPKAALLAQEMVEAARRYNEDYRVAWTEGTTRFTLGKTRHRRMIQGRSELIAKLLELSKLLFQPGSPLTVVDKPVCLQSMAGVLESVGENGEDYDTIRNLLAKNFVQVRKLRMPPELDLRLVKDEESEAAAAKPLAQGLGGGPPASIFPAEVESCLKAPEGAGLAVAYLVQVERYRQARERLEGMEANWRAGMASAEDLDRAMQDFGTQISQAVAKMAEAEAHLKSGGFLNTRLMAYLKDPVHAQLILERYAHDPIHSAVLRDLGQRG